jgi:hypothetical protein
MPQHPGFKQILYGGVILYGTIAMAAMKINLFRPKCGPKKVI